MKKVLSIMLALCMILGMSTVALGETVRNVDDETKLMQALADGADVINLEDDIEVAEGFRINHKVTINGNGHTLKVGPHVQDKNAITVELADGVVFNNITLDSIDGAKSTLHVYRSEGIVLNDVTVIKGGSVGGVCVLVNASTVSVTGQLTLVAEGAAWGGVNVDIGDLVPAGAEASLTFEEDSSFDYTGDKPAIYFDPGKADDPALIVESKSDKVDFIVDENGHYVVFDPTPIEYDITDGENPVFEGEGDITFTIDADESKFVSLSIDGEELTKDEDYTVESGSTIITLTEAFLLTLENGDYLLRADFSDGFATTNLNVNVVGTGGTGGNNEGSNPNTGDMSNIVWIVVMGMAGLAAVTVLKKKEA